MNRNHRRISALAGAFLLAFPVALHAEEPVETALKGLIAGIDASPTWAATYRGLTYDPASGTATLTGLSLKTETGDVTIDVETIAVAGYQAGADGSFAARTVTADGATVNSGFVKISIGNVDLDDIAVPTLAGVAYDPGKPFTSMVRIYSEVLKARLAHGRIGNIAVIEKINEMTSRISYEQFTLDDLKDGRIASVHAGPLTLESPSPEGLVGMSVGSVEAHGIDIGAMLRVYNPDAYVGGVGDMVWHTALEGSSYQNISLEMPGAKLAMSRFSLQNFKVRQPKASFAEFFDKIIAHPGMSQADIEEISKSHALDMLSAFGFGRFGVTGISVTATGIDRLQLADFHVSDLSSDGLGEVAFSGLDGAVEGQGSIKVDRFAFGGITFPSIDLLRSAIAAEGSQAFFDPRQLMPTLGFFEAGGIEMISTDLPRAALDKLRVDLGNYVGVVPTSVSTEMTGLDLPAVLLGREGQQGLARLGLDRVRADYRLKLGWDAATETLNLGDLHLRIANLGAIGASGAFGGLTRAAILAASDMNEAVPGLSLINAKITFTDDSIVDKGLAMLAEKMHFPPDKIRQQFADALPFLLSVTVLTDPTMMKIFRQSGLLGKVTPAIKTFMAAPGSSITVTLAPPKPVPLESIAPAVETAPETVVDMLGFSMSADAGPAPSPKPAPAEPEKMRPTQPAN